MHEMAVRFFTFYRLVKAMRKKRRGECEVLKKEEERFWKNSILGGSRHRGGSVMIW